jgi:hypothetical protein
MREGGGNIGEGRPGTWLPVDLFIPAGVETAAQRIGWMKMRSGITASSFQIMLRPATCFLMMRTMVPIMSRKHNRSMTQPYMPAALALACTSSQSLEQMSEPWHSS